MYRIRCIKLDHNSKPQFWSNKMGWVNKRGASRFKATNRNLPIDGIWEEIPQKNA
jgi:hypothetical protein